MTCTQEQPHLLVAAHNLSRVEDRRNVMDAADINGASSGQRAMCGYIHITAIAAVGSHAAGPAASCFASIVASKLPLPCLSLALPTMRSTSAVSVFVGVFSCGCNLGVFVCMYKHNRRCVSVGLVFVRVFVSVFVGVFV